MGFLDLKLRDFVPPVFYRSRVDFDTVNEPYSGFWSTVFGGGKTKSGVSVSEESSLGLSAVYSCVKIIAETVSSLPFNVHKRIGDGNSVVRSDHPIHYLIHNEPHPDMTSAVWREMFMYYVLLWGNGYAVINRNGEARAISLTVCHPSKVTPVKILEDGRYKLYYTIDGYARAFDASDVIHIPALGFDGKKGKSPIRVHMEGLGLNMAAQQYGASFFGNGANMSGILKHPGKLSAQAKQNLTDTWSGDSSGPENWNKTKLLEEGMEYTRIGIPPNEAQFIETRKFGVEEVCRIFNVPPHKVKDLSRSTNNNIEHQSIEFITDTIMPWVVKIEQEFNRKIFSSTEKGKFYTKLNLESRLRGDTASRTIKYKDLMDRGVFTINDVLRFEDMNTIGEEGNRRFIQGNNMVPLDKVDEFLSKNTPAKETQL